MRVGLDHPHRAAAARQVRAGQRRALRVRCQGRHDPAGIAVHGQLGRLDRAQHRESAERGRDAAGERRHVDLPTDRGLGGRVRVRVRVRQHCGQLAPPRSRPPVCACRAPPSARSSWCRPAAPGHGSRTPSPARRTGPRRGGRPPGLLARPRRATRPASAAARGQRSPAPPAAARRRAAARPRRRCPAGCGTAGSGASARRPSRSACASTPDAGAAGAPHRSGWSDRGATTGASAGKYCNASRRGDADSVTALIGAGVTEQPARTATIPTAAIRACASTICIGSRTRSHELLPRPLAALGEIAQLVEHTTENRGVPGSSPGLATRGFGSAEPNLGATRHRGERQVAAGGSAGAATTK